MRDALAQLAKEPDVQHLALEIHERLQRLSEEPADVPALEFDREHNMDWEEGVEEFRSKTPDELWTMLGLSNTKALPDFNTTIDPHGHNPWEHPEYMEKNAETLRPMAPRWHQLVGIVKLVEQAFRGEPLMLMDEVGIGKTMQVFGCISVITFFREFYAEHGYFPGAFIKYHFNPVFASY